MLLIVLLLEILLFCGEADATITWNAPPPQRGPLQTSDGTIRRTTQRLLNGSSEERFSWNFTLSGEILDRVTWEVGNTRIGRKTSSGTVTIDPTSNFQEHFGISASDPATLIIYNVTEADEAVFSCSVETNIKTWTDEIQVKIVAPSKFTIVSNDTHTVREGSNLQLLCEASGLPAPNITWVRILQGGSESEVLHRGPSWDFLNINSTDAGTYRCKADNGVGNPATHAITVTVLFSPRISLQDKYYVGREKSVSLHCQVEGYPTPTITWTPCKENVCDKSRLNISNVQSDAVYNCTVKNSLGNASASTNLVIGDKIINLTLTITSEKCTDGKYDESFWKKLQEPVNKLFANQNGYNGSTLLNVRCGSLIVDLALKFTTIVTEQWVLSTLRSAITDGKLGELSIDASSIAGIPVIESTATPPTSKTTPRSSDDINIAMIVGIVVGGIVFIIIVAVVVWRVYKKKESMKHNKDASPSEIACEPDPGWGNGENVALHNGNPDELEGGYHVDVSQKKKNRRPVTDEYARVDKLKKTKKKPRHNGNPCELEGGHQAYAQVDVSEKKKNTRPLTVEYAQVDKPKKTKKKPKKQPGELVYAEVPDLRPSPK